MPQTHSKKNKTTVTIPTSFPDGEVKLLWLLVAELNF